MTTKEEKAKCYSVTPQDTNCFECPKVDKRGKLIEQKPVGWSEEDEHRITDTIYFLETAKKHYASTVELDACISWLELLKKRLSLKNKLKLVMNKVEPKFHEGEWIITKAYNLYQVTAIIDDKYQLTYGDNYSIQNCADVDRCARLWTIQDAKDGDVLAVEPIDGYQFPFITIYKNRGLDFFNSYCLVGFDGKFYEGTTGHALDNIHPATKEQRDFLFAQMEEAGYEWDADEKELRLIEYNGEDYGIDSLYHAKRILEKTLGKVDGYQSDDGILEHKCAITVLKRLYEHKPIGWAQDNVKELNEFENAMLHVGMSFFGKNADLSPNDTDEVREQAKLLLGLAKTNKCGDDYNPYKAVVESIAKMCDKYEAFASDEAQMRDFLCNVKAKCHEAVEYDKKYCQN